MRMRDVRLYIKDLLTEYAKLQKFQPQPSHKARCMDWQRMLQEFAWPHYSKVGLRVVENLGFAEVVLLVHHMLCCGTLYLLCSTLTLGVPKVLWCTDFAWIPASSVRPLPAALRLPDCCTCCAPSGGAPCFWVVVVQVLHRTLQQWGRLQQRPWSGSCRAACHSSGTRCCCCCSGCISDLQSWTADDDQIQSLRHSGRHMRFAHCPEADAACRLSQHGLHGC